MNLKRWALIFLLWQLIGVVITIVVSIPFKDFHHFIHELIICLSFTNSMALLVGSFILLYVKIINKKIGSMYIKIPIIVLALALIISVAIMFSLEIGKIICKIDGNR